VPSARVVDPDVDDAGVLEIGGAGTSIDTNRTDPPRLVWPSALALVMIRFTIDEGSPMRYQAPAIERRDTVAAVMAYCSPDGGGSNYSQQPTT
jgi:hypothetical protein